MSTLQAILIAIIEGLTEYLPVSSTGHMIIASSVMGIASQNFTKLFTVAIQMGAILAVIVLYYTRFIQTTGFYVKLFIAFLPAAFFGKLLNDYIDALLENPLAVAITLLLGGIILLFVDKWFTREGKEDVTSGNAFKIGLFQCIALIPGVSRSAATIIGGLSVGLTRTVAAEFSFFLAVPTMFAATAYKLYKYYKESGTISVDEIQLLAIGNLVAFAVALIAIKGFISYLTKHGFKIFGYYRIILGLIILLLSAMGYNLSIV